MKHKWHDEIVAWAGGAEIEQRYTARNHFYDKWEIVGNPKWCDEECEYRIKPQPKEPKYLYVIQLPTNEIGLIKEAQIYSGTYIGKIKLEQDDD